MFRLVKSFGHVLDGTLLKRGSNRPSLRRKTMKRTIYQYIALGLLFVVAAGYHFREADSFLRGIRHPESRYGDPFQVSPTAAVIEEPLSGEAQKAALRKGDLLLAVNRKPYVGTHVLADALARPVANNALTVTVRTPGSSGASSERTVQVPLATYKAAGEATRGLAVTVIVLYVAMPFFCLILGFWVALVRPRDPLAWLLLGIMLGFGQIIGISTAGWGPVVRDLATAYRVLANNFWAIGMLLFGIYFPEPFPEAHAEHSPSFARAHLASVKRHLEPGNFWRWVKWALILPIAIGGLIDVVTETLAVENLAAVSPVARIWATGAKVVTLFSLAAVSSFFACLWAKGGMAVSQDARRRLRWLRTGTATGLTPLFILIVIGLVRNEPVQELVPGWLFITSLLLMFLFPLTMAYTIVVQRAMDVRVVVRQGLQYALARGGVRGLQFIVMVAIAVTATLLASNPRTRLPQKLEAVCFGMAAVLWMKRGADRLRAWTDRRFFRDAYNAEQILSELSEKVRSIVETQPLLATVSHRIAESLHVPRVAVLLDGSGPYRPAYTLGFSEPPSVAFLETTATVRQLAESAAPTRVYRDDPDSWIYRRPEASDEERRQLTELGTELLLPLSTKDHLLGFISLGQKRSEAPYSRSDLRLLTSVAVQTGMALENARLTATVAREVAQREKLDRELEIAREVQQRLFPQKRPPIAGLDYAGTCRPALGVGGDYYDFLALPGGQLGIAVGDVSGKGIAAALMMATLQASLRGEAIHVTGDLGQMMRGVNRLVFEASTSNRYATFFYAQYDPRERTLGYVNAGHNPPMLFRKCGQSWQVMRLDVGGTVIGLLEDFPFVQAAVAFQPGDLLVAYTDGVSEAMNPADEEWGEDRMREAIEQSGGLGAAQLIESILAAADAFAAGAPQHDDMTLVALRVLAEGE